MSDIKSIESSKNNKIYDTVCMSGGGIKGISFIGALDYLQLISVININQINHWVGTSAGAILAYLFSLEYSIQEIKDFILDFNFSKLQPEISIDNLFTLHGIDNGAKMIYSLTNFLKTKYNLDDITFSEHYKLTNKKLTIIGTNFSKGIESVFNFEKTPDMSIILAVRISISVPIIFIPVLYNSDYYVDGALVNNFPINHCNSDTTLGLYIKNGCSNKLTNILSLINGCFSIIADTISLKDCTNINEKFSIVEIENYNYEYTNFNLNNEQKLKIINLGKTFAKKYIENQKLKEQLIQKVIVPIVSQESQIQKVIVPIVSQEQLIQKVIVPIMEDIVNNFDKSIIESSEK